MCKTLERFETSSIGFSITAFSSEDSRVDVSVSILRLTSLQRGLCFYFDHTRIYRDSFPSNDPRPPHLRDWRQSSP